LLINTRDGQQPIVVPAALPAVPVGKNAAATIEISVIGAPSGARISVDSSQVNENPFKVQKGEAIIPIRVEADGFEPFSISVTPSMNRVIQVTLKEKKTSKDKNLARKRTSRKKRRMKSEAVSKESTSSPAVNIQQKAKPKRVMLPKSAPKVEKPVKKSSPERGKTTVEGARGTKMKTNFE
jgi:hypothetical protein